jgi:hypothetical protein
MSQVIVFKQDSGVLAVVHPSAEALLKYGIEAIARKDVPAGKPFRIMELADIPTDRALRNAWTIDDALLSHGVGSELSVFEGVPE